jgi:hypothetical protein
VRQRGITRGQRVLNRHPAGGALGEGISLEMSASSDSWSDLHRPALIRSFV